MAKITRATQKIFAGNAPQNQLTAFGSINAGNPIYSKDVAQIMTIAFQTGWAAAIEEDYAPYRQDANAINYAVTSQLAYLFQEGVPEWDAGTTYYTGSIVKVIDTTVKFYVSKTDDNTSGLQSPNSWYLYFEINPETNVMTFYGDVNVPLGSLNTDTQSTLAASQGWVNDYTKSPNILHSNMITNCLLSVNDSSNYQTSTAAYFNNGCNVSSGMITGFSSTRNIVLTKSFPSSQDWQFDINFGSSTSANVTTQQVIAAFPNIDNSIGIINNHMYLALNGTVYEGTTSVNSIAGEIYLRLTFDGSNYYLQSSTNGSVYTLERQVAFTEQPFGGKTITLGSAGNGYPNNYYAAGYLKFPTITSESETYWTSTTTPSGSANLIHFVGSYIGLAPNGRALDGTIQNTVVSPSVDSYMNYTTVNGTKTILITADGELMARQNYTASETAPSGNLSDIWYNTKTNVMYQFGAEQPNFTNNGATVSDGVVSELGSIILPVDVNNQNVGNQFEVNVTTGSDVTTAQLIATLGNNLIYVSDGAVRWDIPVTVYKVEMTTQTNEGETGEDDEPVEPEYETTYGYVISEGFGSVPSGTVIYSDEQCTTQLLVSSGNDYSYSADSLVNATISVHVDILANTNYQIGTIYLDGNYTLNVGNSFSEVISHAVNTYFEQNQVTLGGTNSSYSPSLDVFTGTIDLSNTGFEGWVWNGVSSSSSAWNRFVGVKIGTVTDDGTSITNLSIDEPIRLANDSEVVHNIGNEDVRGVKSFLSPMSVKSSQEPAINFYNTSTDTSVAPETTKNLLRLRINDSANQQVGQIYSDKGSDGNMVLSMNIANRQAPDLNQAICRLHSNADGTRWVEITPARDSQLSSTTSTDAATIGQVNSRISSIMSTSNFANNYTKFTKGSSNFFVQWGSINGTGTVTFPTPFIGANPSVCVSCQDSSSHDANVQGYNVTKTTFQNMRYNTLWIAVGR